MKQHRDCYDEQDDASLVASVLLGKREAFDILLQRHSASVFRMCTRLLGNTFEAQDIAQEAALQAFLGLSRLQEPARFGEALIQKRPCSALAKSYSAIIRACTRLWRTRTSCSVSLEISRIKGFQPLAIKKRSGKIYQKKLVA